jgi:hypothetical protein
MRSLSGTGRGFGSPARTQILTLPASHRDSTEIKNDLNMKAETIDKQTEQRRNWVTHPTRRNILIIGTAWFVGNGLLVLSTTDLFTESFISKRYIMIYVMMIMSTWTTFQVTLNYFKTRRKDDKKY